MIDPVSKNQQSSHQYWDMFAQSGDPQMYLKYKNVSSKKDRTKKTK